MWDMGRNLFLSMMEMEEAMACREYTTCDDCLNASYACHFCAFDFQCHAIGSPLGCVTGVSACHHLQDCERKEPEHVGYGPPVAVVMAVLCMMLVLVCCVCGISTMWSIFCRRRATRPPSDDTSEEAQVEQSQLEPLLSDEENDAKEEAALIGDSEYEEGVDRAVAERLRSIQQSDHRRTWGAIISRSLWLAGLATMTVLALMFYPRIPDYNVCNREFEWESVLQSLLSLHPKIHYEVLLSAVNENRFGFVVQEGSADIYHRGRLVGYWRLEREWVAEAGAISDVIAPVRLQPDYSQALALWQDFSRNELMFNINASIVGSITWGSRQLYEISSAVSDIEFLVGAEYDRGLCKCSEYLTPV